MKAAPARQQLPLLWPRRCSRRRRRGSAWPGRGESPLSVTLLQLVEKHAALFEVGDVVRDALFGGRNVAKDSAHRFSVVRWHESEDLAGHLWVSSNSTSSASSSSSSASTSSPSDSSSASLYLIIHLVLLFLLLRLLLCLLLRVPHHLLRL